MCFHIAHCLFKMSSAEPDGSVSGVGNFIDSTFPVSFARDHKIMPLVLSMNSVCSCHLSNMMHNLAKK